MTLNNYVQRWLVGQTIKSLGFEGVGEEREKIFKGRVISTAHLGTDDDNDPVIRVWFVDTDDYIVIWDNEEVELEV